MRKLSGLIILLFCFTAINAQIDAIKGSQPENFANKFSSQKNKKPFTDGTVNYIQQGDWVLDGGLNFKSSWYETNSIKYTQTRFGIHPQLGYFVIDQLEIELSARFENSVFKYGTSESKSHSYSIMPGLKYYFFNETKKVNLFAEAEYGFGSSKDNNSSSVNIQRYDIQAGPVFFLKPHFAVQLGVGYGGLKYSDDNFWEHCFDFCCGFDCYFGPCGSKEHRVQPLAKL